jgi:hypothetical protein
MVAPAIEERQVFWTTYDNLLMWFMSFRAFLLQYKFATLDSNGNLVFLPKVLCHILKVDGVVTQWEQHTGGWMSSHLKPQPASPNDDEVCCQIILQMHGHLQE